MDEQTTSDQIWLRNLVRIYVIGLILLAIAIFVWKVVFQYSPWFDVLDNPVWAGGLTIISIVLLPLILGGFVKFGVNPVLGKWHKWSELMSLEDRIVGELEKTKSQYRPEVVLIDWPNPTIQTIGILTARFPATETQPEMASVFCPSSPRGKSGNMRFVKVADLHFTDWTIHEFQGFNLTLGAIHPELLLRD